MPAIKMRVEPLDRDIAILIDETLSPKAQSAILALAARTARNEAIAINRAALGREPKYETFVDGRKGASLESVKPPPAGIIVFEFDVLLGVFAWIGEQLVQHSPVGDPPLHYHESHIFLADGRQVFPGETVPVASRYEFLNTVPYSRKIERGWSPQAPDGVYQVVAKLAQARLGNVARVRFVYRALAGVEDRTPAILIIPGGR
jgi:hypothetical protein